MYNSKVEQSVHYSNIWVSDIDALMMSEKNQGTQLRCFHMGTVQVHRDLVHSI